MFNQLLFLTQPEVMITILVAFSVFATVLTIASPMFVKDGMQTRMKGLTAERQRLRAAQKAALGAGETRLRERPKGNIANLVEALNLKKLFEAESSRKVLREAGLRSEKNLVTFLAVRLVSPFALALGVFVYVSTVYANEVDTPKRLVLAMFGAVGGYYAPVLFLKNLIKKRQLSIRRAWSDALDLLLICVESGMSIELALQRVAREIGSASIPLAEELTLTCAELSYLPDRRKAFENLALRTGLPTVKSVVTSLIQSERYGTPLGTALRVLAQENRDQRMSDAEKKAAALPPKLTVPMVLFFLPVIFVVILGPSAILVLGSK